MKLGRLIMRKARCLYINRLLAKEGNLLDKLNTPGSNDKLITMGEYKANERLRRKITIHGMTKID